MKVLKIFLFTFTILLVLQGCNNDEENVSEPPNNAPIEDDTTRNGNVEQQNEPLFHFTSFDLDIDYEDNQDFDVDYENENDGMEAEIEDDLNGEKLSGDEAFERLRPIFEGFTFDQNTDQDEVISEVLAAFDLNEDYTKFELEVTFTDGTEKEYTDM